MSMSSLIRPDWSRPARDFIDDKLCEVFRRSALGCNTHAGTYAIKKRNKRSPGRRAFIAGIGSAAAWPVVARVQQTDRMRRVGILMPLAADDPNDQARLAAFLQGLQETGWSVGRLGPTPGVAMQA